MGRQSCRPAEHSIGVRNKQSTTARLVAKGHSENWQIDGAGRITITNSKKGMYMKHPSTDPASRRFPLRVLHCSVMTLLLCTNAQAQLEEVIVTAQKRAQSANDIGMSITTFSGENLQELGVVNTIDLASLTPGFTFTDTGTGVPVYTLRGVGFNDQGYNAQSAVTVYVDEIVVPYPVMTNGALLDIERVEILKGPQGTLYGRNTTGGAINYISSRPTRELEAGLRANYGRFDTTEIEAFVSGPLGESTEGRLAFRTVQSGEGWQENTLNESKLGERDTSAFRLSVASELTDRLAAQLQVNWWSNESDTQAAQFVRSEFQSPANSVVVPIISRWHARAEGGEESDRAGWVFGQDLTYDMNTTSINLKLDYQISDTISLASLTGYSKFNDDGSRFDRNGFSGVPFAEAAPYVSYLDLLGGTSSPVDPSTWVQFVDEDMYPWVPNMIFTNDAEIEFFSQEFRLLGETEDFNWVGGIYFSQDENTSIVDVEGVFTSNSIAVAGAPFLGFFGAKNVSEQDSRTIGAYLHSEWQFRDNARLTAGLRYSDDEIEFFGCLGELGNGSLEAFFFNATALAGAGLWYPPGATERGCLTVLTDESGAGFANGGVSDTLEEDSLSFKLALDWFVSDSVMLYGAYSRGFKAGGYPNLVANVDSQYRPTDQEQLDAFELGLKATLLDGAMQFNASAYHYEYRDKQLLGTVDSFFGALRTLQNVSDSSIDGLEADLQWKPTDGLLLQLTGSYIDSKVDEYAALDAFAVPQVFDGSPFPFTPEFQANAVISYAWGLSDSVNGFATLDASYSDSINTDFEPAGGRIDPNFIIDSYTLVNARVGIAAADSAWRLSLWARNIGDEFYTNNVQKSTDQVVRYTGMPRTYGLTVEYNVF